MIQILGLGWLKITIKNSALSEFIAGFRPFDRQMNMNKGWNESPRMHYHASLMNMYVLPFRDSAGADIGKRQRSDDWCICILLPTPRKIFRLLTHEWGLGHTAKALS